MPLKVEKIFSKAIDVSPVPFRNAFCNDAFERPALFSTSPALMRLSSKYSRKRNVDKQGEGFFMTKH